MDAFLASQYDMCELICSHLDTVSISNLAHTNMRLFRAVADFHRRPKLLVEDSRGDFTRAFNPVTQVFTPVRLTPVLEQHIARRHPKQRGNKRRIRVTDTGHPHAITLESGTRCSMVCTKEDRMDVIDIPITAGVILPDCVLTREFSIECPEPGPNDLPANVWELYESFMMADWGMSNLNKDITLTIFDRCFWAEDLGVLILHKARKMWIIDPKERRKVLLPDFLDVAQCRNGRNQRNFVDIENFVYQDGYLVVVGDVVVLRRNDSVVHKKLFTFDLRSYVKSWKEQSEKEIGHAFTQAVTRLAGLLEKYCAPIENLMQPHLLLNLSNLSFASQMNVMMLITAINTGLVVQSDIRFDCLGRVPWLPQETHFDRFPESHLLLLRTRGIKRRYYLICTKTSPRIVAVKSFHTARITSHSVLPFHHLYCADQAD